VTEIVPMERIEKLIYMIRGQKVILDRDLAAIYGVPRCFHKDSLQKSS
jgi:hypothetical protein